MTKLIPFLKNLRIANVKKWVYEERRGGSRTGRLFQKCLIKLVQNLTQYFSYIVRYHVLTTPLYYTYYTLKSAPKKVSLYHRNGLTIYFIYLKIGTYSCCFFFTMDVGRERRFLRITVRRTCSGSEHFFVWPEQVAYTYHYRMNEK